jgi:hypothetical protein
VGLEFIRLANHFSRIILTHQIHRSLFAVVNIKLFHAPFIFEKFPEILLTLTVGS